VAVDKPAGRRAGRPARLRAPRPLRWAHTFVRGVVVVGREGPFLWRSFRLLRQVDLLVVAGSGPLTDLWQGPWQHPYRVFRWAMLARLARVPMIYPSVGAGPIDGRVSAFFIRRAVTSAAWISVRDSYSRRVLGSIGLPDETPICPDLVYGLPDALRGAVAAGPSLREPALVVGVNVMAHRDPRYWPRGDQERHQAYVRKMASFAQWLLDNGHTVRFFSSQIRSDPAVFDDVRSRLNDPADSARVAFADHPEELSDFVALIATCDLVVAARYHSVLVPLLLGVPVLGLAYNPKTTELLAAVGRSEQCFDIDTFEVSELIDAFSRLRALGESMGPAASSARVREHREAVEHQFDTIFGPVRGEHP
jgi:polysaccharide pyruvyl transferase WcaK-like protein